MNIIPNIVLYFQKLLYNMYHSLFSIRFYQKVYSSYRGFGIKYIFSIIIISVTINCIAFLWYIDQTKDYLQHNTSNQVSDNLNNVFEQWPPVIYQDKKIQFNDDSQPSTIITTPLGREVILIDPYDKIKPNEKNHIPVVLQKEYIAINLDSLSNASGGEAQKFIVSYNEIIATDPYTLDSEGLKSLLLEYLPIILNFTVFSLPILISLISLVITIINKLIIAGILLVIASFMKMEMQFKQAIRLAMFAAGVPIFLQFFALRGYPIHYIILLMQLWCNGLIIYSIITLNKAKKNRSAI